MEVVVSDVVPSLAGRGVFGPGQFVSVRSDNESDHGWQFGSVVAFLRVNMRRDSGQTVSLPIVVKIQYPDEESREMRDSGNMFSNEVAMFQAVLPYLNTGDSFCYPKLYYGHASTGKEPEKDVVILENVKHLGYSLGEGKLFLDYDHICAVMKAIGKLHSWSYAAKARDRTKFLEIAGRLQRIKFGAGGDFDFQQFTFACIKKGVKPLLANDKDTDILNKFVEAMTPVFSVHDQLLDADERFGVVIHGDFCKNNMFFKYDSDGKPTDVMFFDFQLSKYASPAADLSFFLYMHTDAEMRANHWDHFLQLYWASVKENVPGDIHLPDFEEFHEHFSSRAVYGYIHCSYFAPHMILDEPVDMEEMNKVPAPERHDLLLNLGGEEGEKILVDIVSHLLEKKYIHKFLDYCSTKVCSS